MLNDYYAKLADNLAYNGTAGVIDQLDIGGIGFQNVVVAFTDVPPFARFGLAAKPALLLGMDALKLFRQVEIDFANRQIRFARPRGNGEPTLNVTTMPIN